MPPHSGHAAPPTPTPREPLAADFEAPTREAWERLARAKDGDPDRPLRTELEEQIAAQWLYTAEDQPVPDPGGLPGAAPYTRGVRVATPWGIRQRTAVADRARANADILADLEGGASEILLSVDPSGAAGVAVHTADELDQVLSGVHLDLAPLALEGDPAAAGWLLDLLSERGHEPDSLTASLGLDPIGDAAARGEAVTEEALTAAIGQLRTATDRFPHLQVLAVDTARHVDAGAGGVLELALALATGVAYLRAGDAAGIDPSAVAAATEFRVAVGPDQFLEIARLRALRRLWAGVLEHCGVPGRERRSPLAARTSRRMYSSLDPWVNLLRATTATFAAAVGGADSVCVLPFDEPSGTGIADPGPLGRRTARNTQLLLSEEASLHRVADPAGGSYYVESLTDQLSQAAWARFVAIEQEGGIDAFAAGGGLADELAAAVAQRRHEIATRRRSLTGVNEFPLLGDDGLARPATTTAPDPDAGPAPTATAAPDTGATAPVRQTGAGPGAGGLLRDGADFEALRARAATVPDARILLACTGPLAAHVGVAQWAKSFFEAGGIETIASGVDPDIPALLAADPVAAAAICVGRDSDPAPTLAALRQAGVKTLYSVGADIDGIERVRDGVDMIAVLGALLDRLEEA